MFQLAKHHQLEEWLTTNPAKLCESFLKEDAKFGVLVAMDFNGIHGYLSFTWNFSIWRNEEYMNIDDVFVAEAYRGQNIGERLMVEAKKLREARGAKMIKWEVEKDNHRAMEFYKRLGANMKLKGIFTWS